MRNLTPAQNDVIGKTKNAILSSQMATGFILTPIWREKRMIIICVHVKWTRGAGNLVKKCRAR